jgi:hypothetical protein
MKIHPSLKSWVGIVSRKMPHLSKPQAVVLAMWSFGIAITQSSGLTTVSVFLAKLLGIKENTMRQRLREWLRNADEKKGNKRKAIEVTSCFAPLLSWILSQWQPGEQKLALAIAMLWLVSVGGSDETANCQLNQSYDQQPQVFSTSTSPSSPPRLLSCFRPGFLSILVALLWGQPLPVGHFYSFAWTNSISFSSA